ncbi:NAD-binding protein [Microlunatus sp. GCM10028923]|uniref:NAD-binding protein n=1 Tax=Microlunatus sp. GCM10028923 TaxID=3273400 RepID=UPI003606A72E
MTNEPDPESVTGLAEDHVVIIGSSSTTIRLAEELERAGERVIVIVHGSATSAVVADLELLGAEVLSSLQVRPAELRRAGIERAKAAVIVGEDDVFAIRVALAIEELNPAVRLVIELTNPELGSRLGPLFGEHVVLSSAELAAPAFVGAALASTSVSTFEIGGRRVIAGPRSRVGGTELVVLGDTAQSGRDAVLPASGDLVLGTELVGDPDIQARRSGMIGALAYVFDRRVRVVLLGLLVLILLSTIYFHLAGSDWLTALYRALAATIDTGLNVDDLGVGFRFGAVLIQVFGLVLSSGVTAVIVDAMISARLPVLTGGIRGKPRHHVVICGLGRIGTSVAARLRDRGVAVVAIEHNDSAPGVLWARRAKVPVIIAAATDRAVHAAAGIGRAAAVLALTDDDAANLEIGLVARETNPEVRVVLRMYDDELADRVEHRLGLKPTRSVSMLAAPAFASAALGRRREIIYPVGRRVLLFTEVTVQPGSAAPGQRLRSLGAHGECTVLAFAPAGADWSWQPINPVLRVGDRIAVVASRSGLASVLLTTKQLNGATTPTESR